MSVPALPMWHQPITNQAAKQKLARKMAERLHDNDIVGVGSGSTCFLALQALASHAKRLQLQFTAVPTSLEMELCCTGLNIPMVSLRTAQPLWSFDGADEVDADGNLIKGRGGALFREKLVMKASPEVYILVDESKRVKRLGEKFPVPVEVFPEALQLVQQALGHIKEVREVTLRTAVKKDGPVITESGNLLLDVDFRTVPLTMEQQLKAIPGVIESGLFVGYKPTVLSA